ncbi:Gfo/Idh/MocA family oxidoreductase [uncultured Desulfobulbus sp.]|uniref:Gfo/Idh/MocA family protein n=1 Tax=uncultured Desulfobulbus sp. TaxID=239745 RepID=UPI0029C6C8ED|nr:Gfo/Idh/MocA family oxidoreductase [uncultured Desulfobulbus sp.]
MVKVGIIGCGNISHFHYEGYERAGAKLTHFSDLRLEAAEHMASKYGAKASSDYKVLLADPDVDLVSITTISSAHKQLCLDAIKAGKGVVCEKTLTENPTDSAEIARAADEAGVFCATAYMKRFFPGMQQAKEMLADMGDIISIHARSWQPGDYWNCEINEWLLQRPSQVVRNYGGGVLVCGGSHILDLIHWLAGRPVELSGDMFVREGLDFDIRANALMNLENGGIVNFEVCWHPLTRAGYERNGWDERLEINTTKGRLDIYTVKWDTPQNNGMLLVHQDAFTGTSTEYRFPAYNPFDFEMAEMVRRFEAGEKPSPSAWDGYVVDELIAHIIKSSKKKTRLPIKWVDRS